MDIKSVQKYTIRSPRKLREVVPLIKKMTPLDAVDKLPFIKNAGAETIRKVIQAAVASARQKGISDKDLIFKEIQINEGPRLKRFRAGARGRAKPYRRRMSHIRVILTTAKSEAPKPKSEVKVETNKNLKSQISNIKNKVSKKSK